MTIEEYLLQGKKAKYFVEDINFDTKKENGIVFILESPHVEEIKAGKEILCSLGFYNKGSIQVVSCPTCGRTKIDLIKLSSELKARIEAIDTKGKDIKVALMGCVVNGPGEARECHVGVAGGKGEAVLFKHGEIVSKIPESQIIDILVEEIHKIINS